MSVLGLMLIRGLHAIGVPVFWNPELAPAGVRRRLVLPMTGLVSLLVIAVIVVVLVA